jgi:hypothetical protein
MASLVGYFIVPSDRRKDPVSSRMPSELAVVYSIIRQRNVTQKRSLYLFGPKTDQLFGVL